MNQDEERQALAARLVPGTTIKYRNRWSATIDMVENSGSGLVKLHYKDRWPVSHWDGAPYWEYRDMLVNDILMVPDYYDIVSPVDGPANIQLTPINMEALRG